MQQGIGGPGRQAGPWVPDLGNGRYKNPVLFADYSDPDIAKFGDGFFLTASSFNCAPGLPLLFSRDLVNWKIVNHICSGVPAPGYEKTQHGKGLWAPTLAVHGGKLWVFVCTPDEGLFMSCTDDPFGKWPEMTHVISVTGWIDPCAFWDDDGNAYLLHAFAKSRVGICSLLHLCKMSPDGTEILDNGRIVVDVNGRHHVMEGPRLFQRGGWYYISAPAGGIEHGYQVTMRSKNLCGPYEERISIHEGENGINGPRQGGFVNLESGESWFMHFQGMGAYGRVVDLEPVEWVDGWPVIGKDINSDGIGEPVATFRKPDVGATYPAAVPQTSERFGKTSPGLQWQWMANPLPGWCRAMDSALRLYAFPGVEPGETLFPAPNLLLQKFPAPSFSAVTKLKLELRAPGDLCGLMVSGLTYFYLAVEKKDAGCRLYAVKGYEKDFRREETVLYESEETIPDGGELELRAEVSAGKVRFSCRIPDQSDFRKIGTEMEAAPGRWIGAKIGIFCLNRRGMRGSGYADFKFFRIV